MTLRQLKAFLAVAQTLSFAEASKKMFMSQPALSLAIKSLEDSVGGQLLVRTTRAVSLTPEGKALYERGRRLVNEWDDMEEEMRQRFALERGLVSIAAMPSFAANQLPEIIARFRQRYPGINVQVNDVVAEETVELVRDGKVELGVTFRPEGTWEQDQFTPLRLDQFVAVLPADHPLSGLEDVSWQQLSDEAFIALQRPSMVRARIEEALLAAGLSLDVAFDSHQLATVGRMVGAGLGVSVAPSLCQQQMLDAGACIVPLRNPVIESELGVLTKRSHELSAAGQAMFDVILQYFAVTASA
ncbi:MAG: LysR family transcriptional regulator [Oceanobacter sp.]|jgi:LysR family carnitine catabolism transcriptional activator